MSEPQVFDSQPYHGCAPLGDVCQTIHAQYGTGGNNMPLVDNEGGEGDTAQLMTLQAFGVYSEGEGVASSIQRRDYKYATDLVVKEEDEQVNMTYQALGVNTQGEVASTLRARDDTTTCDLNIKNLTVRRLTPLECTRLQGYPDGWVDIPGASDSAKYRALGNSICLPFWEHLAHRFAQYGDVHSIGSLFAGIGGFELVFKRAGVATSWSSEIEPFCQRVVAYHTEQGDL